MKFVSSAPCLLSTAFALLALAAPPVVLSEKRIVGGRDSLPDRRPYSVSLQDFGSHFCTGTLVAPDVVMSAGHCTDNLLFSFFPEIVVNPYDVQAFGSESFPYESFLLHPDYAQTSDGYDTNDIVLIKLNGTSSFDPIEVNSNMTFPEPGNVMQVFGWGLTDANAFFPEVPSVLQEADVTYITNERCEDLSLGGYFGFDYADKITDGMMCGLNNNGGGACGGDSGGGMVISGADPASDIQVGIISWGVGCGLAQFAGVGARTSHHFGFIQESICALSDDPPSYLECDGLTPRPSTSPSSTPPVVTVAPTPTSDDAVTVTLSLMLDSFPTEIGWQVLTEDGIVVAKAPPGSYNESGFVTEVFRLQENATYFFLLADPVSGDGIGGGGFFGFGLPPGPAAILYLGSPSDNKAIAVLNGDFFFVDQTMFIAGEEGILEGGVTFAPTFPPTEAPSVVTAAPTAPGDYETVTMVINLDSFPSETSWQLRNSDGVVVQSVPLATYLAFNTKVTESFRLAGNETYNITLLDSWGDGITPPPGEPALAVFLGDPSEGQYLATLSISAATSASATFLVGEEGIIMPLFTIPPLTAPPSPAPSVSLAPSDLPSISNSPTITASPTLSAVNVTVLIRLDFYPYETRFQVLQNVSGVATVVYEVNNFASYGVNQEVTLLIQLIPEEAYNLRLTDSVCDGIFILLPALEAYYGDTIDEELKLASIDNAYFGCSATTSFLLTEVTKSPSSMPSVSAPPSVTLAPSGPTVIISIIVQLDSFQSETGLQILTNTLEPEIVFEVTRSEFSMYDSRAEVLIQVELTSGAAYILRLTDSFCDGLFIFPTPPAVVYFGEIPDPALEIASIADSSFGCEVNTTFVALGPSEAATSMPSTTPFLTAPPAQPSRFLAIKSFLIDNGYSQEDKLTDTSSPQYLAAQSMAESTLSIPTSSSTSFTQEQFMQQWVIMVFYFSTNGPTDWTDDWNVGNWALPLCSWNGGFSVSEVIEYTGVYCTEEQPFFIQFYNNSLSGSLPTELGLLTNIAFFSVGGNDIGGTIPSELGSWTSMEWIDLNYNAFAGTLPDWVGSPTLRLLGLSENLIEGTLPSSLSSAASLVYLGIDDNMLTGSIAPLDGLTNIVSLYAEDNVFEGTLGDTTLANLMSLEALDLSNNKLGGTIPSHLFEFVNMTILDLNGNELTGTLPSFPVNPTLELLALHRNGLAGTIPPSIVNLEALTHLDLTSNDFSGSMPRYLGDLTTLEYLFLADIDFNKGRIPLRFQKLTELRDLSLKNTNRNQEIPTWLGEMDHMILLDLASNRLKGTIPTELAGMVNLTYLLLNRNQLTGSIPTELAQLGGSLLAATFDHNELVGNAAELCGLLPDIYLTSDCFGSSPVDCPCCFECCDPDEADCHSEDLLAQFDPIWEDGFVRDEYIFGHYNITDRRRRRQLFSSMNHRELSFGQQKWEGTKEGGLRGLVRG